VSVAITAVLVAATALYAVRLALGPSLADRVLALNGMLLAGMVLLAHEAVRSGRGSFLAVIVVLALVGFVGTAMIARFVQGRGR
jgi:multicomponent Na+:H+ antiporter subunit F